MKHETEKSKSRFNLEEAEKLACNLEKQFAPICAKLKSLKPEVEKMHAMFTELCKGSVTIAGCRSFGEFCEKKLGRKRQTVYEMLGEYKKKHKTHNDDAEEEQRKPTRPETHKELILPLEDQERLRTGANAARRFFEAQDAGDQIKADDARKEFLAIAEAKPLASHIEGDQPNCRLLLIDLVSDVARVAEKLPVSLARKCEAIRKRLGIDDKSFGLKLEDRAQPKPQHQPRAAEPETVPALAQSKQPVAEIKQSKANSNGKAEVLPTVVNGLHIVQRKDRKFVVFDPTKEENNTVAICAEMEEAVRAAQMKKPSEIQSAQIDSASA
jgi:hypothetical protein